MDKMTTIWADDNFKCIFLNENDFTEIYSQESNWRLASIGQVMAWQRRADKPLPEPMLT